MLFAAQELPDPGAEVRMGGKQVKVGASPTGADASQRATLGAGGPAQRKANRKMVSSPPLPSTNRTQTKPLAPRR